MHMQLSPSSYLVSQAIEACVDWIAMKTNSSKILPAKHVSILVSILYVAYIQLSLNYKKKSHQYY